ncbi:MAG: carboxypeptidase regulatory-like domain-containing protein [Acidobacteria bacterium]|nr:MAG: carboxypeptidase regulatory-like domain-containing protein [Acidobacteriota bacterium]
MRTLARGLPRSTPMAWTAVWLAAAAVLAAPPPERTAASGARLEGVALDPLGRAIAGVEIRLVPERREGDWPFLVTARTGRDGRFALAGLRPGAYRLIAVKGGYAVLVGEIDTMLRRSLELVLHPAGPPGRAGSRPPDGAWALRLPERDRLEARRGWPERADPTGSAAAGKAPLVVEVAVSQRDAVTPEAGAGVSGGMAGTFDLSGNKRLAFSAQHREEGFDASLRDDADALVLRFGGSTGSGAPFETQLEMRREARTRGPASGRPGIEAGSGGARLVVAYRAPGSGLVLRGEAAGIRARFSPGDPADRSASAARFAMALSREWTAGGRRTWFEATVRHAGGPAPDPEHPAAPVVAAGFAVPGRTTLEDSSGSSLELRVGQRWSAAAGRAELRAGLAARGERGSAFGTAPRAGMSLGFSYRLAPAWVVTVDGGVRAEAGGRAAPAFRVGLSGRAGRVEWSLSRVMRTGPAPWAGDAEGAVPEPYLPLIGASTARVDDWIIEAGWPATHRRPGFRIRGALFGARGDLLPALPGDVPLLPVAWDASASGALLDLAFEHRPTGTHVELTWETLEDRGGLLAGLDEWTRSEVRVRQRIGDAFGDRATCHLLLGIERSGVGPRADAGRRALLARRRVSGGVAVAF